MARPTKYKKKYCDELVAYFDKPLTETHDVKQSYRGQVFELPVEVTTPLPTFERFALDIGVTMSTMWEWKQVHPEFSNAYAKAQALQEQMIVGNAIMGRYVGPFAQFYLKNKYGYIDKQATDITTNGKDLPAPILGGLTNEEHGDALPGDNSNP